MEKFMHLISLTIQIHFQYKSDFIWRNIIALLHYIYLVLCIYFKTSLIFKNLLFVFEAYHLHSKTCHLHSKLVTCNWQSLMFKKYVIYIWKHVNHFSLTCCLYYIILSLVCMQFLWDVLLLFVCDRHFL